MQAAKLEGFSESRENRFQVNSRLLLSLYGIVPCCLLIVFIDVFFLSSSLKLFFLPVQPAEWAFWAILFNLPHIISSFVTMVDKEYVTFYQQRLIKSFIVIATGVVGMMYIVPYFLDGLAYSLVYAVFFIFFATYTVYHVLSQQFGIGMMLMKIPQNGIYQMFRFIATISAACLFVMVFAKDTLAPLEIAGVSAFTILSFVSMAMLLGTTLLALLIMRKAKDRFGVIYLVTNVVMLYAIWLFMHLDYTVFVIMLPRFVHDVTAFIIYSIHDQNRNKQEHKNLIYRYLAFLPIPPLIICPILAVTLANSIEAGSAWVDQFLMTLGFPELAKVALTVVFISGFFHYHLESFVWKRDSIHRHSVSFK